MDRNEDHAIELSGLTKIFGDFIAVNDLDLEVKKGSVLGFLGPNGAGKTTTMNMLMGLSKPSSGSIKLLGKRINGGLGEISRFVGYLPEIPSFYGWMKAYEYLSFCGDLFDIDLPTRSHRISELLEKSGLKGVKKPISAFSRGMKQRLGIAQALINEPEIVFLDEPTSALDPIGRKEILELIELLSNERTIILSTHILSDVERVCNEVAILNKGKLIIQSDLKTLKAEHIRPVFDLTFEEPAVNFEKYLNLSWVDNFRSDGQAIRVKVTDVQVAQFNLPKLISESNLRLRSFQTANEDLEDIFMRLMVRND